MPRSYLIWGIHGKVAELWRDCWCGVRDPAGETGRGSGLRFHGLMFRVEGLGFRVQGLGFGV